MCQAFEGEHAFVAGRRAAASLCHRCERPKAPGGVWLVVQQEGYYAQSWEFCSIECLGQHFEAGEPRG